MSEKRRFRCFIGKNVSKISRFFAVFGYFVLLKVYMTSWNLSTTTPGPGTHPASSQRTKQFWSRPHGLYLFLNVGPEPANYGRGMTYRLPLSYWSPGSHI